MIQNYHTFNVPVSVGGATNASSLLTLNSTTQGFLIPRMTTAQRDAIPTPAVGLQIYNTETNTINIFNGTWVALSGGGGIGGTIAAGQVAFGSASNTLAGSNNFTYDNTLNRLYNSGYIQSGSTSTGIGYDNVLISNTNNGNLITGQSAGLVLRLQAGTGSSSNNHQFYGNGKTIFNSIFSPTSGADRAFTLNATFSPTSGTATHNTLRVYSEINQTGDANGVTRGLHINPTLTSAVDWRSIEWSNNTGWGLYGAGTAENYLNGGLAIGVTNTYGLKLAVAGSTYLGGQVAIGTSVPSGNTSLRVFRAFPASNSIAIDQNSPISNDAVVTGIIGYSNSFSKTNTGTLSSYVHYSATNPLSITGTIGSQSGFSVTEFLTQATNNYAFYGNIPSGTGRWNLYMNGTADNYIAGNTGIGLTNFSDRLTVRGSTTDNTANAFGIQNSGARLLLAVRNDGLVNLGRNTAVTTQEVAQINVVSSDTNTGLVITPKGTGAFILGPAPDGTATGGGARGNRAIDLQMTRSSSTRVASGELSVISGGASNIASGSYSVIAGGNTNTANATYSTVSGGVFNNATGAASTVSGGQDNIAAAIASTVSGGFRARSDLYGQSSYASGYYAFVGDNQTSDIRLRNTIANATTELFLDGSSARAVLTPPSGNTSRIWNATAQCVAVVVTQGAGSITAGSVLSNTYELTIKRIGSTTTLVGSPVRTQHSHDGGMNNGDFIISADTTNNALKVEYQPPSGVAADTVIRAVATIYLTELGY